MGKYISAWLQTEQRIFQMQNQEFEPAVSKSKPLKIDGHANIKICIKISISAFALPVASSLKKEKQHKAKLKPNTAITLSNEISGTQASYTSKMAPNGH